MTDEIEKVDEPKDKAETKRPFQFSIRALMIVTAAVGGFFALVAQGLFFIAIGYTFLILIGMTIWLWSLGWGRRLLYIWLALIILYVTSYGFLSRRGFAISDKYGYEGFYFLEPRPTALWQLWNYRLVAFYYPCIFVDYNVLGIGRPIASTPKWV